MNIEQRIAALGIVLPEFGGEAGYYGQQYGKMKPHHLSGNVLFLSGHTAGYRDGKVLYPGRLGRELSVEEGYAAARQTGINCIAGIKHAIHDLDKVTAIVRSLTFTACTSEFTEPNRVASGLSDLFEEVFGPDIGVGGRASIGVMSLADNYCFEAWVTVEVDVSGR